MKTDIIYNDDCLNVLRSIGDSTIDLIYLDPPFYTQRDQSLTGADGSRYEFSDTWTSRSEYLEYMRIRLVELKRVLKDTGNLFLHCNTSSGHYLRVLLDEVFGESNFRSEIIWSYKRWSNSKKGLLPNHQTIFYYSKTANYKFNTIYGEYSPTTNIDQIMQERERRSDGKVIYKRDENGDTVIARNKRGVPMSDVWEIPFLNPKARERTGYPTQKPVELLERIVEISTDKGDIVLDPFCGSGTTLVAAKLLGRKYVGIDVNPDAVRISADRLTAPFKTTSRLINVGIDSYKTKSADDLSVLGQFDCNIVQRNKGIDAILKKLYDGRPVAVKLHRSEESFTEAVHLLHNAAEKRNCSYTILITYNAEWRLERVVLPPNMIVMVRFDAQLESAVSGLSLDKAL